MGFYSTNECNTCTAWTGMDCVNFTALSPEPELCFLFLGWYWYTFWKIKSRRRSLRWTWVGSCTYFLSYYSYEWEAKKFYSLWWSRKLDRKFDKRCNFFIYFFNALLLKLKIFIVSRSKFFPDCCTWNRPFFGSETFECRKFCYVAWAS